MVAFEAQGDQRFLDCETASIFRSSSDYKAVFTLSIVPLSTTPGAKQVKPGIWMEISKRTGFCPVAFKDMPFMTHYPANRAT